MGCASSVDAAPYSTTKRGFLESCEVVFKVTLDRQTRKFALAEGGCCYTALREHINSSFGFGLHVFYVDPEGDTILLHDDKSLEVAIKEVGTRAAAGRGSPGGDGGSGSGSGGAAAAVPTSGWCAQVRVFLSDRFDYAVPPVLAVSANQLSPMLNDKSPGDSEVSGTSLAPDTDDSEGIGGGGAVDGGGRYHPNNWSPETVRRRPAAPPIHEDDDLRESNSNERLAKIREQEARAFRTGKRGGRKSQANSASSNSPGTSGKHGRMQARSSNVIPPRRKLAGRRVRSGPPLMRNGSIGSDGRNHNMTTVAEQDAIRDLMAHRTVEELPSNSSGSPGGTQPSKEGTPPPYSEKDNGGGGGGGGGGGIGGADSGGTQDVDSIDSFFSRVGWSDLERAESSQDSPNANAAAKDGETRRRSGSRHHHGGSAMDESLPLSWNSSTLDMFNSITRAAPGDDYEEKLRVLQQLMGNLITTERTEEFTWLKGKLLGRGAFGQVYIALDTDHRRLMAVKSIEFAHVDMATVHDEITRVEHEIDLLRRLDHPNIVNYYGCDRGDAQVDRFTGERIPTLNIFLEFVECGSLQTLTQKHGGVDNETGRAYAYQMLQGLLYLHNEGIMHRDIKPANVLVSKLPSFPCRHTLKIADFGASTVITNLVETVKGHKTLTGTPNFMAPEVIMQQGHGRPADIWSFGCTMIELLSGKPPWSESEPMAVMFAVVQDRRPPAIPTDAGMTDLAIAFIEKTLAFDPDERPSASRLLAHSWLANMKQLGPDTDDNTTVAAIDISSMSAEADRLYAQYLNSQASSGGSSATTGHHHPGYRFSLDAGKSTRVNQWEDRPVHTTAPEVAEYYENLRRSSLGAGSKTFRHDDDAPEGEDDTVAKLERILARSAARSPSSTSEPSPSIRGRRSLSREPPDFGGVDANAGGERDTDGLATGANNSNGAAARPDREFSPSYEFSDVPSEPEPEEGLDHTGLAPHSTTAPPPTPNTSATPNVSSAPIRPHSPGQTGARHLPRRKSVTQNSFLRGGPPLRATGLGSVDEARGLGSVDEARGLGLVDEARGVGDEARGVGDEARGVGAAVSSPS